MVEIAQVWCQAHLDLNVTHMQPVRMSTGLTYQPKPKNHARTTVRPNWPPLRLLQRNIKWHGKFSLRERGQGLLVQRARRHSRYTVQNRSVSPALHRGDQINAPNTSLLKIFE